MIRIIIAEDQAMLREAMVQLIELREDIKVVSTVEDGHKALEEIEETRPDIALLDIEMPKLSGLDILAKIREQQLDIKVIIVTTFKRPGYFESAIANDVDAYVLKERSVDELIETMYKVMRGEKEYSPELVTSVFKEQNPLTPREQLVLREVGEGRTSKEISQKLFLSNGTVRNYISTLIDKLQADNRFDAWKKALDKGWI
ncbi:response regulator transcription factor [Staphylococcus sp. SQ8-PEA]|uniref:Response regulator transcription factor n=1 Tax=Staphylococcus marylandisciuri TaxID=2981529 RepID=A0ABT2QPX8_9STAP|nr:response regulator transcription factor [Staphylococcus marylandisciuri]MCU5746034.1 response regulator transcription factor [Staphylococcus marylandisciuri]